jgi:ATP-binding cassette subfamily A (ABC1) protein 3
MTVTNFTLDLIFPIGNLFQALVIGLNVFLAACRNDELPQYPGSIFAYGGPILYLCIQVICLFTALLYLDKGILPTRPHNIVIRDGEEALRPARPDVDQETRRVEGTESDLLRIVHLSKSFDANLVVDDATLGMGEGEILALLGPNGAGKTTIINMLRGELQNDSGAIYIHGRNIQGDRFAAQQHLGGMWYFVPLCIPPNASWLQLKY